MSILNSLQVRVDSGRLMGHNYIVYPFTDK